MQRRTSLDEALRELEGGTIAAVSRIVVSRRWWDSLADAQRNAYHRRVDALGISLGADDLISLHFVELMDAGDDDGAPPLSSERRV